MTIFRAFAVATVVALVATPLSATPVKLPQSGASEKIGPAATGKPKPYWAQAPAECTGGSCVAEFGKKNGKMRSIEALTCIVYSNGKNAFATVHITESAAEYHFIMPAIFSEDVSGLQYSTFNWTTSFQVPAGQPLTVRLASSGDEAGAVCTAYGEIS